MRLLLFLSFLIINQSFAQNVVGHWKGHISMGGVKMKLVFHIEESDDKLKATMDSPDQGAFGIPISRVEQNGDSLIIGVAKAMLLYKAKIEKDSLFGVFKQGINTLPLNMVRTTLDELVINRPQTPKAPYPYIEEEVVINNKKEDIELVGTLSLPKEGENFPAVILVSGSGPQDRNETLMQHEPFHVIADYLTRNGIAVLRYDDRGVGKSGGDFASATTFNFVNDASAAVDLLMNDKRIDKKRIGVIGHSEGGLIAPMVANKQKKLSHVILLAGPGLRGKEIISMQSRLIMKANGSSEEDIEIDMKIIDHVLEIIVSDMDMSSIKDSVRTYMEQEINAVPDSLIPEGSTKYSLINQSVSRYTGEWMINFIRLDPKQALLKTKCAVFAVNGAKDLQVPANENIEAIARYLEKGKCQDYETKIYENLNHLFQNCDSGSPDEYGDIEETFSPIVLSDLLDWIKKH